MTSCRNLCFKENSINFLYSCGFPTHSCFYIFIQPLRRVSHLRPLKWINKFTPVYDAYFYPLKDRHQYWFGVKLLVRGILFTLLPLISATNPGINVFILFLFMAFLFFFMAIKNIYKKRNVRLIKLHYWFLVLLLTKLWYLKASTIFKQLTKLLWKLHWICICCVSASLSEATLLPHQ